MILATPLAASWCEERTPDLLRWLFFLSGSMTRGYSLSGRPDKFVDDEACQSNVATKARVYLDGLWTVVDTSVEGEYFFREGYSVVDVYIVMQLLWDRDRESLFSSRPRLKRLFEIVTARPAIGRVIERHATVDYWQYDKVDLPALSHDLSG